MKPIEAQQSSTREAATNGDLDSSTHGVAATAAHLSADRWTSYSALVLAICILGWAFDIYEADHHAARDAASSSRNGASRRRRSAPSPRYRAGSGSIGTFIFPVLADLYGRKPVLIWSILGYSLFTGLTGFSTGWITL